MGIVFAVGTENRQRGFLIALLGCAAFVVPAAQLHDHTGWSLDKHLAYGMWFAAIAAGYACSRLIGWLPRNELAVRGACCAVALAYPAVSSWQSAWQVYHSWPNTNSFISAFKPIAERSQGIIFAAAQIHVAEYYIPQVSWTRWSTKLALNPVSVAPAHRESYYSESVETGQLRSYSTVLLDNIFLGPRDAEHAFAAAVQHRHGSDATEPCGGRLRRARSSSADAGH